MDRIASSPRLTIPDYTSPSAETGIPSDLPPLPPHGLHIAYTPAEYLLLPADDENRNPLNDFLILREIPGPKNPVLHELVSHLLRLDFDLADHLVKASGTDKIVMTCRTERTLGLLQNLLVSNPSVVRLDLAFRSKEDEAVSQLCKLGTLQEIRLHLTGSNDRVSNWEVTNILEPLGKKSNLTSLALEKFDLMTRWDIDSTLEHGTPEFTAIIKNNPGLHTIALSNCDISKDASELICKSLKTAPSLTKLRLSNCGIAPENFYLWGDMIASCPKLEEVDLSHNDMSDINGTYVMHGLSKSKTIKKLDISFCQWDGFPGFAYGRRTANRCLEQLFNHPSLRELDISGNPLHKDAVAPLFQYNADYWNLICLNISGCALVESDVTSLAELLQQDPPLEVLDLRGTGLDAKKFGLIGKSLEKNTHLRDLKLSIMEIPAADRDLVETLLASIQPILANNADSQADKLAGKWSPAFAGDLFGHIPSLSLPPEVAARLVHHVSRAERAADPLRADARTDKVMHETVLSLDAQTKAQQPAETVPNVRSRTRKPKSARPTSN